MPNQVIATDISLAPKGGEIAVISVGTSSSRTDLSLSSQLGELATKPGWIQMRARGGDVGFYFNNSDSGTASLTATSGGSRSFVLNDGESAVFKIGHGHAGPYTWLVHVASSAATLHIRPFEYSP